MLSLIKEYWEFLKTEKKRWMVVLLPLVSVERYGRPVAIIRQVRPHPE